MIQFYCKNCGKTEIIYRRTQFIKCSHCGVVAWAYDPDDIKEILFNGTVYITRDGELNTIIEAKPLNVRVLEIPEGVKTFGSGMNAIYNSRFIQEITIPSSFQGKYLRFSEIANLKKVTVNTRDNLSTYCFHDCSSLEEVHLSKGVTSIEKFSFSGCNSLKRVTFSKDLWKIEKNAFWNTKVEYVAVPSLYGLEEDFFSKHQNHPKCFLVDDDNSKAECYSHNGINYYSIDHRECMISSSGRIGDTLYCLPYQGEGSTSITLPTGVKTIAKRAFIEEPYESIEFSNSVSSIQAEAFYNCDSLKRIRLNDGLVSIGEGAFWNTHVRGKIKELVIPSTVQYIGDRAFKGQKIEKLVLPEGLETIGDNAFSDCMLTEVDLPTTLKRIPEKAFKKGTSFTVGGVPLSVYQIIRDTKKKKEIIGISIQNNQKDITKLTERIAENESTVNQVSERLCQRIESITKAQDDFDRKKENEIAVHSKVDQVLQEKIRIIAELQQRINDGKNKIHELDVEKSATSVFAFSQKKRIATQRAETENAVNSLMIELQINEEEKNSLQKQIDDPTREMRTAENELKQLKEETDADNLVILRLTKENETHNAHISRLQEAIEEKEKELIALDNSMEERIQSAQASYESQKRVNEKERLINGIGKPAFKALEIPSYEAGKKCLIDEIEINQTLEEIISTENEINEKQAWKVLLSKNVNVINNIKALNKELGLDEFDGIESYKDLAKADRKLEVSYCLPERFAFSNRFLGKMDSWQLLQKCIVKGSNKLEQSKRAFFGDAQYRVLAAEPTAKKNIVMFPYCIVSYTEMSPFKVSLLDDVKVTCKYQDKDVEDRKGDGVPPKDKEILSQQYLHSNADGSPNKRYKYNPIVFKTRESWLEIKIGRDAKVKAKTKTYAEAERFVQCFNNHVKELHDGDRGDVYDAICKQKGLDDIRSIVDAYEASVKEQKERLRQQQREIEEQRKKKLEEKKKEEERQRAEIIERQKRINEERKAQKKAEREKQKKIRAMFMDDDFGNVETEKGCPEVTLQEADNGPLKVTKKKAITNNVFKVTFETISSPGDETLKMHFVDIDDNTISNTKKVSPAPVGGETKVGFVLNSGINFTQMKQCILIIESSSEEEMRIPFEMNISYYSDF